MGLIDRLIVTLRGFDAGADIAQGLFMHVLVPAYTAPGRHYHNLDHIEACLNVLHDATIGFNNEVHPDLNAGLLEEVQLALWFHDVVYDVRRSDNEEQSALMFGQFAKRLGFNGCAYRVDRVANAILATKHESIPDRGSELWETLTVDADLSILAADWKTFLKFDQAIRNEYRHVPIEAFRAGRLKVLQSFLARERIYRTPYFTHLEPHAKYNLETIINNHYK